MKLTHLTDKTLLNDTKFLVGKEREFLTKILHHLKEIDKRKLYSDLGYSSLFDYCVRDLGYSEGNAQRRIQACRLLASIPDLDLKIENGELSLSNISLAATFFRQNDIENLSDKKIILDQLENLSKKEGEKMLFAIFGEEVKEKGSHRRISSEKIKLSLVLSETTFEKCEKLKSLLGKSMSYPELINYMVVIAINEIERKKFKILRIPKVSPPPVAVNRVISSATKREVYLRDKKRVKCGSLYNLNFDHQLPFALGGSSDAKNIRLLCFNCNQRARILAKL